MRVGCPAIVLVLADGNQRFVFEIYQRFFQMELRGESRGGSDAFWPKDDGRIKREAEMSEGILGWRSSTYGYRVFLENFKNQSCS
jgi:hypothetical protein